MTFQESIMKNVLCKIGILHGLANKGLLLGALKSTHPECNFEFVDSENKHDLILIYDCYDFAFKFYCYVNEMGYIYKIEHI